MITHKLKKPLDFGTNGKLTTVAVGGYSAGQIALSRAAIFKHPQFGPPLAADEYTMMLFLLPLVVKSFDALALPLNWQFQLSTEDYNELVAAVEAQTNGFDSIDAYREHLKQRQAQEKAAQEAGKTVEAFPGNAAPPVHEGAATLEIQ